MTIKDCYEEIDKLFSEMEDKRKKYHTTRSEDISIEASLPFFRILNMAGIKLRKKDALIKMDFSGVEPGKEHFIHLKYIKENNTYSTDTICFNKNGQITKCYDDNTLKNKTSYFKEHGLIINDSIDKNSSLYKQLEKILKGIHKFQVEAHLTGIDGKIVLIKAPDNYTRAKKLWSQFIKKHGIESYIGN